VRIAYLYGKTTRNGKEMNTEIFHTPPGLSLHQVRDRMNWPDDFELTPVRKEKLRVGDLLLARGLTGGLYVGSVRGDQNGNPYFVSYGGSVGGALEFGGDDRQCWVCKGLTHLDTARRRELR